MKSVIAESSTIAKAIELGLQKAGNPTEFMVKVFQEAEHNMFGMTKVSAKIGIFYDDTAISRKIRSANMPNAITVAEKPKDENPKKPNKPNVNQKPNRPRQPDQQRKQAQSQNQNKNHLEKPKQAVNQAPQQNTPGDKKDGEQLTQKRNNGQRRRFRKPRPKTDSHKPASVEAKKESK